METYFYLADSLARHHIQDLVADADASRRTKQARASRPSRGMWGKTKHARAHRG
jgi:hypothetical protein